MWLYEYKDDLYMLKLHDMCMIIYERELKYACTTQPCPSPQQISLDAAVKDQETQNIIPKLQQVFPSQSSRGYFKRTVPLPKLKNDKGKSPMRQDVNIQNTMTKNEVWIIFFGGEPGRSIRCTHPS
jgi:hypothetical protein